MRANGGKGQVNILYCALVAPLIAYGAMCLKNFLCDIHPRNTEIPTLLLNLMNNKSQKFSVMFQKHSFPKDHGPLSTTLYLTDRTRGYMRIYSRETRMKF